jgi:hypothetical protein
MARGEGGIKGVWFVLQPICAGGHLLKNSGGREPVIDYLMLTENIIGPSHLRRRSH